MACSGTKLSGPSTGPERVLADLVEVQRMAAPFRIEDARGREVPATLDLISEVQITIRPQEVLDLIPGAKTQLVFFLDGLRFKASSRVLVVHPDLTILELPQAVELAERRKSSRGYLSAREGAAAMAMAGLFNPLAARSTATPDASLVLITEVGVRPLAMEGFHPDQPSESSRVEVGELGPPQTPMVCQPWLGTKAASGSGFWVFQAVDWLKAHQIILTSPIPAPFTEPMARPTQGALPIDTKPDFFLRSGNRSPLFSQSPVARRLGNGALSFGITYTFMSHPLAEKWRHTLGMNTVKLEVFGSSNRFHLGVRLK